MENKQQLDQERSDAMAKTYSDFDERRADAMQKRCDAIAGMVRDAWRHDDDLGIFAYQLTIQTLSRVWVHEHSAIKWMNGGLVNKDTSVDAGAVHGSYTEINRIGRAKIVEPGATDIPLATISGRNNQFDFKTVKIGIEYTRQDVRTAQMQARQGRMNFDIVAQKVAAAREGHDRTLNNFLRSGVPGTRLYGMTSAPGIFKSSAVNGDWANDATTATQILDDFRAAYETMIDATDEIETPTMCVVPIDVYQALMHKRTNPGFNSDSVMDTLNALYPGLRWESEPGMRTAGESGSKGLLLYRNEQSRLMAQFPLIMSPEPPRVDGGVTRLSWETRFGGIVVPRPRSVFLLSGV